MFARARRVATAPAQVVLLVTLALTVALWFDVLTGRHVLVGGDAVYGVLPWIHALGAHSPSNSILADTVRQMLPWQRQVADAFRHGRLPLWNPYAFSGNWLQANDQSAAFSPFTLLALPFDAAHGLSLAMLAKFWVAGLGTFLFLRQLGSRALDAAVAGVAFATSSFMVIWLGWPHSSVAALVPWAFASLEWYLVTRRRHNSRGAADLL